MKMILKTNSWFILMCILLFYCCSPEKIEYSSNSFEAVEYYDDDDCSIYSMNFIPGNKIIFKISTSGDCSAISPDSLLNVYRNVLKDFNDLNLLTHKGKVILLELPSVTVPKKLVVEELTSKVLRHHVEYSQKELSNNSKEIILEIGETFVK